MDKETFALLKSIVSLEKIPLYSLIDQEKKRVKKDVEAVVSSVIEKVHSLARLGLIELKLKKGDEGNETHIISTKLGKAYVKRQTPSE